MDDATPDELSFERAWRGNLLVCTFGAFTTVLAMTLLLPFLPSYVAALGVRSPGAVAQWSGITFGATFLASGVAAPFWGASRSWCVPASAWRRAWR